MKHVTVMLVALVDEERDHRFFMLGKGGWERVSWGIQIFAISPLEASESYTMHSHLNNEHLNCVSFMNVFVMFCIN